MFTTKELKEMKESAELMADSKSAEANEAATVVTRATRVIEDDRSQLVVLRDDLKRSLPGLATLRKQYLPAAAEQIEDSVAVAIARIDQHLKGWE